MSYKTIKYNYKNYHVISYKNKNITEGHRDKKNVYIFH